MVDMDALKDRLGDEGAAETGAGVLLIALGAVGAALAAGRQRSSFLAWFVPALLLGSGVAVLLGIGLEKRSRRMEEAEELIAAELEGLDPFARAKVLKDIAAEQLEPFLPAGEEA